MASVAALFFRVVGWSSHEFLVEKTGAEAREACLWGGVGIKWDATVK